MRIPKWRSSRLLVLVLAFSLVAAACGDDDDDDGAAPTTAAAGGAAQECSVELDESLDEQFGANAGQMAQWLACAQERPLQADDSLEPYVIGLLNSEGDPSFTFPDITAGTQAAVDFINNELGGIGGDPVAGTPGRPIRLETCFVGLDPADSVRCANELAEKKPVVVIQGFNNNSEGSYQVLNAANVVNIAGIPVNLADYNTEGVFAPAPGGGCVGAHPALVEFAVNELGARRVAVAWFDIPNGAICYHDAEKKPMNVLNGSFDGPADAEGSVPDLEHAGVPIPPGAPDLSSQATQLLDFEPDAILYSAPTASCVSLVNALAGLGWSAQEVPAVFTGACFEQRQVEELGDRADGIYYVGAKDAGNPATYEEGLLKDESEAYLAAMEEYQPDAVAPGFAATMFQDVMFVWHVLTNAAAESGLEVIDDPDSVREALRATVDHHMFAGSKTSCGRPVEGYNAVCNTLNSAVQWDASTKQRNSVKEDFDGAYIIAGTELDPAIAGG